MVRPVWGALLAPLILCAGFASQYASAGDYDCPDGTFDNDVGLTVRVNGLVSIFGGSKPKKTCHFEVNPEIRLRSSGMISLRSAVERLTTEGDAWPLIGALTAARSSAAGRDEGDALASIQKLVETAFLENRIAIGECFHALEAFEEEESAGAEGRIVRHFVNQTGAEVGLVCFLTMSDTALARNINEPIAFVSFGSPEAGTGIDALVVPKSVMTRE
jgi:hypothetical protein